MGLEFLDRVRRTSIFLGSIAALFAAAYMDALTAGAWILGFAWSLVNIYFIAGLVKKLLSRRHENLFKAFLLLAAKFPVLYMAGFILLKTEVFPIPALLAGFFWPFFVIIMKALGRTALKLDDGSSIWNRDKKSVSTH